VLEAVAGCRGQFHHLSLALQSVAARPAVFDLVLLDDKNPRSVLFQIQQLAKHFERFRSNAKPPRPDSGKSILQECVARLTNTDTRELAGLKENLHASEVGKAIQQTLRDLPKLSTPSPPPISPTPPSRAPDEKPNYKFQLTIFMRQKIQFSFLLIVLIGFFFGQGCTLAPVFVLWNNSSSDAKNCVA